MRGKYHSISEYGYIASRKWTNEETAGTALVSENDFNEIEDFVLQSQLFENGTVFNFLLPCSNHVYGRILKAQNYVGVIQTREGTTIEILPKIYTLFDNDYNRVRRIFVNMLRSLKDSPFKKFNDASLQSMKMNLMDIFIAMFLDELGILIKKGLKSGYINIEGNERFYKGRLLVGKQINYNTVHKELFYVQYDSFNQNRIENRIIKSTLIYLFKKTASAALQAKIREFLFAMNGIDESKDCINDLGKCYANRLMSDYDIILKWCSLFLRHKSFINYKGKNNVYSLLFPMDKIFENYIAKAIREGSIFREYDVRTQERKYHLIEEPQRFLLRPDIVLRDSQKTIIMDTKWKMLNNNPNDNYGVSQGDLYQMYAYGKKYNANKIVMLYPMNESVYGLSQSELSFKFEEGIIICLFFVDLENMADSLDRLHKLIQ